MIKWHWGPPALHQKCQIYDSQNKDRLSIYRLFILQRKPKLGRAKPATGPNAACGLDIAVLDQQTVLMTCLQRWQCRHNGISFYWIGANYVIISGPHFAWKLLLYRFYFTFVRRVKRADKKLYRFPIYSNGFTHRPNRPWPRVPRFWGSRATLSYENSILTKNLRNCAEA